VSGTGWTRVVGWGAVALAAASLCAALGPFGWPFELFTHFRWQLGVAAVVFGAVAVALRQRWMLVVVATAAAAQGVTYLQTPNHPPPAMPANDCGGATLRVASINLWYRHGDPQRVLQWLRTQPADVVVLQELTPAWQRVFAGTLDEYEHRFVLTRTDPYGIGLLSSVPLEQARAVDFAGDGLPSVVAVVHVGGRPVQLVGLHTAWPLTPRLRRARDLALRHAARQVRQAAMQSIVAGDLNLTPYAPGFATVVRASGLRDAFAGRLWRPTWRADFWPLSLPIDHVLVPPDACVVAATIGGEIGSDHRPIGVTLRWR
jgi:endonuclease/exonuclease/phosphatase (EEP) superfamily protein YafD